MSRPLHFQTVTRLLSTARQQAQQRQAPSAAVQRLRSAAVSADSLVPCVYERLIRELSTRHCCIGPPAVPRPCCCLPRDSTSVAGPVPGQPTLHLLSLAVTNTQIAIHAPLHPPNVSPHTCPPASSWEPPRSAHRDVPAAHPPTKMFLKLVTFSFSYLQPA